MILILISQRNWVLRPAWTLRYYKPYTKRCLTYAPGGGVINMRPILGLILIVTAHMTDLALELWHTVKKCISFVILNMPLVCSVLICSALLIFAVVCCTTDWGIFRAMFVWKRHIKRYICVRMGKQKYSFLATWNRKSFNRINLRRYLILLKREL